MKPIYMRQPEEAFRNAIKKGMKKPEDWMYMLSDDKEDYFKNRDTREYVRYSYK